MIIMYEYVSQNPPYLTPSLPQKRNPPHRSLPRPLTCFRLLSHLLQTRHRFTTTSTTASGSGVTRPRRFLIAVVLVVGGGRGSFEPEVAEAGVVGGVLGHDDD